MRIKRLGLLLVLGLSASCGGATAKLTDGGVEGSQGQVGPEGSTGDGGVIVSPPPGLSLSSKIDLLFMIDNSQSMGDKQAILQQSVGDLLTRLLNPDCVDAQGNVLGASSNGQCASGKLEFAPLTDMHVGIVTSSLGGRGSDACPEPSPNPVNAKVDTHNDDRGELVNRSDPNGNQSESPVADASPANFLAWFPPVASNTGKPPPPVPAVANGSTLTSDFVDLVSGVHQFGCGFEVQDEAWYRFLIQPDPYDHISRDVGECAGGPPTNQFGNTACYVGVDATILRQRHDFLRPDSLVAIVMLTDENSGEVVYSLAIDGQGWAYMDDHFPGGPGTAAMGTSACGPTPTMGANPGPLSPACTSCAFSSDPNVVADKNMGGNCSKNGGYYDTTSDQLNTRGVYDKQRFGLDPRYPVMRYINGLASAKVPDRNGEHVGGDYAGNNDCSNPLFSATLPTDLTADLCNLPPGPRGAGLVFLVAITGVPHQLLQVDPTNPNSPQKSALTANDWIKILGEDPESYDFTGIDPHMFVSIDPRPGLPPPAAANGTDPIQGREWNTGPGDQQYACTFPLPTPRDCAANPNACDCGPGRCDTCTGNANCVCPPLCGDGTTHPFTTQVMAKAYPSPRELEEVKAMGPQGVVSSLCPIHPTEQTPGDPLFGYRPAAQSIVDHIRSSLTP